ncbi:glycosyltransferase family 2 protein [Planctomycetaceae bacterium SH139]
MSGNNSVSVVIPCYNASLFLRETISSVLSQTRAVKEVIVIDDGSTDDSAAIAENFGNPVRVIRQHNQGESVARNRGIDEAQGEWLAFLDADDVWEPDRLERLAALQMHSPSSVGCFFNGLYRFHDKVRQQHSISRPTGEDTRTVAEHLANGGVLPSTALVLRELAQKVRFPENTRVNEDLFFFCQLRRLTSFYFLAMPLTGWRVAETQQSRASDYEFEAVIARNAFLNDHLEWFSPSEVEMLRRAFAERLVTAHENAFWKRDLTTVRACRRLYCEIPMLSDFEFPQAFSRRLFPSLFYRIKDAVDRKVSFRRESLI